MISPSLDWVSMRAFDSWLKGILCQATDESLPACHRIAPEIREQKGSQRFT